MWAVVSLIVALSLLSGSANAADAAAPVGFFGRILQFFKGLFGFGSKAPTPVANQAVAPHVTAPVNGFTQPTAPQPQPTQAPAGPSTGPPATVKGTMWADQTDAGGCQMPQAAYSVQHAVALGQSDDLGTALKWRNGLCGQVLTVNCGGAPVDAMVASTCNLGSNTCGVDLIRKSWNTATGNKAPGIEKCTVSLSTSKSMNEPGPVCFQRPDSGGASQYFASLGVFNTEGRVVKSATINNAAGKFQSGSSYFDFNQAGQLFVDASLVTFTFEDGGSPFKVPLKDCKKATGVNIWK